jgi:hypothetical protein
MHSRCDGMVRRGHSLQDALAGFRQLPDILAGLMDWATRKGHSVDKGRVLVNETLQFWLDETCATCHGTRWEVLTGKPNRPCSACHATGKAPIPHGNEGRALLAYIDAVVSRSRGKTTQRLRAMTGRG